MFARLWLASEFYPFAAVIERGGYWYWVLAVIAILNSVVSLFYYAPKKHIARVARLCYNYYNLWRRYNEQDGHSKG